MTIVFELLLLTILPSLFLLIYFIKTDKYPEPTPILIKTFTLGILICFPAGYLNYLIINDDYQSFLAAITEEPLKFLILYFYIKRQKHFDEPIDGIVYGATASLGFATFENFDYVFNYAESMEESFLIAGVRSFSAVPMHALCGAIMGFHFGQYIFKKQNIQMLLCLLVPILIHASYNYATNFEGIYYLFVVLFSMVYFQKIKKRLV